jgi:hypothetical protein
MCTLAKQMPGMNIHDYPCNIIKRVAQKAIIMVTMERKEWKDL